MYDEAPFIVAGAPYSGAYLITGMLRLFGVYIEESPELKDFHSKTLETIGCPTSGFERVPPSEVVGDVWNRGVAREVAQKIRGDKKGPWGFCDQRNAMFIDQWKELFPNARLIIPLRHPSIVAKSLSTKLNLAEADSIVLWYELHERLSDYIGDTTTRVYQYDRILENPLIVAADFSATKNDDLLGVFPDSGIIQDCVSLVRTDKKTINDPVGPVSRIVQNMWTLFDCSSRNK